MGVEGKYGADLQFQGQRETNQTNVNMNNANNMANFNLANKQNQWNIDQWNRQNEYNSPLNQLNLLRQAGLNPLMANPQFSRADSVQSADMANQQPGHQDNPYEGAGQIGAMHEANKINAIMGVINAAKDVANNVYTNDTSKYNALVNADSARRVAYISAEAPNRQAAVAEGLLPSQVDANYANVRRTLAEEKLARGRNKREGAMLPYSIAAQVADTNNKKSSTEYNKALTQECREMLGFKKDVSKATVEQMCELAMKYRGETGSVVWKNAVRESCGFDPDGSFWSMLGTMFFTHPENASAIITNIKIAAKACKGAALDSSFFDKIRDSVISLSEDPETGTLETAKSVTNPIPKKFEERYNYWYNRTNK